MKLTRAGSTLFDFQDPGDNILSRYAPAPYDEKARFVLDELILNPKGSSIADFYDNVNALYRALEDAAFNYGESQVGHGYSPVFLQFKHDGSPYPLQSEIFGYEEGKVENYISGALRSRLIANLPVNLKRRPYWEEPSEQSLFSSTANNNNNPVAISGVRGNVPAPLKITLQAPIANQDRLIIGCRVRDTIANFTPRYQAEAYSTRGSGVADLTDSDFSTGSGSPQGQKWTPGSTAEQSLLTWVISDPTDQYGVFRVYVRCRDNSTANNTKIRVRAGITTAGETVFGDYGDGAKYANGSYVSGGSVVGGSTAISLVDCGVIRVPPIDTNGQVVENITLQLMGQAGSTGASHTFDIDEIFLMPTMELPYGGGFQVITFPEDMGTAGNPIGVSNAYDRYPRGYLDTSGTIQQVALDVRGKPLYAWTNKSMRLFILTQNSGNGRHDYSGSNTITVSCVPRYRFPGRGS